MHGTGRVNKVFPLRIFINGNKHETCFFKMVTNMKLAFTNVPFRHNLACVTQKWLRFKRVITVRLAYVA